MKTIEKLYYQQEIVHKAALSAKNKSFAKLWVDKYFALKDKIKEFTLEN
jgi:hypothetical protein